MIIFSTNPAPVLLPRRWFILLLCTLLLANQQAYATQFKIATISPDGSSWMKKMRAAAKQIQADTDNRVKFKFYPGGVMGSDSVVLRKIRLGQLQGGAFPGGSLVKFAPNVQLYNLPLLFHSFDEVDFVRQHMDAKIVEDLEQGGFVTFGLGEGGLAYLMGKAPATHYAELRQRRVWVPAGDPGSILVLNSYGISPIPLAIGDVLPSLQTGLIDTVAISPIGALALQWHTQVSHMTDLPLLYFYAVLAINKKDFAKLSEPDQDRVRQVMGAAFEEIDKQNRIDNLAAFQAMQKQGIQISTPSAEEVRDWRTQARKAIDSLVAEGEVDPAMYRQLTDHLDQYRSRYASP